MPAIAVVLGAALAELAAALEVVLGEPAIGTLASSWCAWPARGAALGAGLELAAAWAAAALDANLDAAPIAMEMVRAAGPALAADLELAALELAFTRAAALAAAARADRSARSRRCSPPTWPSSATSSRW